MLRRLRSMMAWNERYRAGNPEFDTYYGSMAPRSYSRGELDRDVDPAIYRISLRL